MADMHLTMKRLAFALACIAVVVPLQAYAAEPASTEAPADAAAAADDDEEVIEATEPDTEALEEILANESAVDEVSQKSDEYSRYHWGLQELLKHGFAASTETNAIPEHIKHAKGSKGHDWQEELHRRVVLSELMALPSVREKVQLAGLSFDIPLANHPLVDSYIDYFSGRGRWFFARWLSRSARYIPIMQPILQAKGLPKDLVYLAMIESGFSAKAYSSAAASGFWQFIQSTGRSYGLRNDAWVDERRDFILATHAAANYLSALYHEFGDWHLAWAGYNAGSGRVGRALKKYNATTFWNLLDHDNSLAKETQHYVPKLLAAALIAKDPHRYGFTEVQPLEPLIYEEIVVNDATDLRTVSSKLNIQYDVLHDLNPALRYGVTPPGRSFTIRVPKGEGPRVAEWLKTAPVAKRVAFGVHKVKRGETLSTIAKRYRTTVNALCEFNKIKSARVIQPGKQLVIPAVTGVYASPEPKLTRSTKSSKPERETVATASKPTSAKLTKQTKATTKHRVGRGDTLWSIAARYRVTVQNLKRWNGLRTNNIGVGKVLEIF